MFTVSSPLSVVMTTLIWLLLRETSACGAVMTTARLLFEIVVVVSGSFTVIVLPLMVMG
jgi:hypothetical protein